MFNKNIVMETITVGEFKTHFYKVLKEVKEGVEIAVTYGKSKEIVGYFIPKSAKDKKENAIWAY
jgi:antitoxin (DNA-binding transcriptional repressor) of toxin-antitoxin stability system